MKTAQIVLVILSALLLNACGTPQPKPAAVSGAQGVGNYLQVKSPLLGNVAAQLRLGSNTACQALRSHMVKAMAASANEYANVTDELIACSSQDNSKILPFRSTYSVMGGVLESRAADEALCQQLHTSMLKGANKKDAKATMTALSNCENSPVF